MTSLQSSRIYYSIQSSSFGEYLVAITSGRIAILHFVNHSDRLSAVEIVRKKWPQETLVESPSETKTVTAALKQDFINKRFGSYNLLMQGTPFQKIVWQALTTIPFGTTVSYADVATMIGRGAAVRAVAHAIGQNQIALLIPCHRVICRNQELGGYRWGIKLKKTLIEWEHPL